MIRQSFSFLDRIGPGTDAKLREQNIQSWDDFLRVSKVKGVSPKRTSYYARKIMQARSALYNCDSSYFKDILPTNETWRLYDFFREDTVFLDIETSSAQGYITVIGLFDGISTKTMVHGINMDMKQLAEELRRYKLIVTFNGSVFDVPFIKKRYPELVPEIPHIDLRFLCSKVGLTGGLKEIEKKLGIRRNKIIEKMYGGDAITLYRMFRGSGDPYYLDLLIEYNEEDVINLKKIMEYCYQKLTSS